MIRLIIILLVCSMLPFGVLMLNDVGNFSEEKGYAHRQYLGDNDDGSEALYPLKDKK